MTTYTLQIHRLDGAKAYLHHEQRIDFDDEWQAAMLLVATREALPPRGFAASMTFQAPGTGTTANLRPTTVPEAEYLNRAQDEIMRRGINASLSSDDRRALLRLRDEGRTAVEAGAQRAMDYIRA